MIRKIKCSGCGEYRRWNGYICLDICACHYYEKESDKESDYDNPPLRPDEDISDRGEIVK